MPHVISFFLLCSLSATLSCTPWLA